MPQLVAKQVEFQLKYARNYVHFSKHVNGYKVNQEERLSLLSGRDDYNLSFLTP